MPRIGVRGVYARKMIVPVIRVMKAIGYARAIVFHGAVDGTGKGMDEASVCGPTWCAELTETGEFHEYQLQPAKLGLAVHDPADLAPENDLKRESKRFVALIQGRENGTGARRQALELNAALILKVAGKVDTIPEGMACAARTIDDGKAFTTLEAGSPPKTDSRPMAWHGCADYWTKGEDHDHGTAGHQIRRPLSAHQSGRIYARGTGQGQCFSHGATGNGESPSG